MSTVTSVPIEGIAVNGVASMVATAIPGPYSYPFGEVPRSEPCVKLPVMMCVIRVFYEDCRTLLTTGRHFERACHGTIYASRTWKVDRIIHDNTTKRLSREKSGLHGTVSGSKEASPSVHACGVGGL